MKVTEKVKAGAKTIGKFGAGFAGVAGGGILASKIPDLEILKKIPVIGEHLAKVAPGLALMIIAVLTSSRFKNEYVERGAEGLGIAAVLDILRRTGWLAKINAAIPGGGTGLSGPASVKNFGDYPPSYFMKSNWAGITPGVNGLGKLGAAAYSLEGFEKAAYALSGRQSGYGFMPPVGTAKATLSGIATGLERV